MSGTKSRQEERTSVNRVELVTIFRDSRDLPYEQLLQRREELSGIHTVFSVAALVRDISYDGLGIKFEGQQLMAGNVLKPLEDYVVKLTLVLPQVLAEMAQHIKREGNYFFLLLKMTCRWYEPKEKLSTAGFELRPDNPPAVVRFMREHFGLGAG